MLYTHFWTHLDGYLTLWQAMQKNDCFLAHFSLVLNYAISFLYFVAHHLTANVVPDCLSGSSPLTL